MRCQFAQLIILAIAYGLSYRPLARAQITVPATILEAQDSGACSPSALSDDKQPAAHQVTITEFTFDGDLHMPIEDQDLIAASLKERRYSGNLDEVTSDVLERTRRAWQDHGYFKVQAQGKARVLTSGPVSEHIWSIVQIDERASSTDCRAFGSRAITKLMMRTPCAACFPLRTVTFSVEKRSPRVSPTCALLIAKWAT